MSITSILEEFVLILHPRSFVVGLDVLMWFIHKVLEVFSEENLATRSWVAHAAGSSKYLFVLRLIFRQECDNDMHSTWRKVLELVLQSPFRLTWKRKLTVLAEAVVMTHEVGASTVSASHQSDPEACDSLPAEDSPTRQRASAILRTFMPYTIRVSPSQLLIFFP